MKFIDLLTFALSNIWAQKLRTFLTFSAISIGGLLVFVLPSLGLGVTREVKKSFETQDAVRTFDVAPKYEDFNFSEALSADEFKPPKLLKKIEGKDIDAIAAHRGVTGIRSIVLTLSPERIYFESVGKRLRATNEQVPEYSQAGFSASSSGVELGTHYLPSRLTAEDSKLTVTHGRYFETADATSKNVLVNQKVIDALGLTSPNDLIGKSVTITFLQDLPTDIGAELVVPEARNIAFTVVGITKPRDDSSFEFPKITLPFKTAWEIKQWQAAKNSEFAEHFTFTSLSVVTDDAAQAEKLSQEFRNQGFSITTAKDQQDMFAGLIKVLVAILSSFGIIALTVGALNVINTMLMAVTERTREIGVLRALGASRTTILNLFLVESAMIAFLGGLMGVIFGWIVSLVLNAFLQGKIRSAGLEGVGIPQSVFEYSLPLVLGVLGFVTLIGLLSGLMPAIRASRLKVVDSLRYE